MMVAFAARRSGLIPIIMFWMLSAASSRRGRTGVTVAAAAAAAAGRGCGCAILGRCDRRRRPPPVPSRSAGTSCATAAAAFSSSVMASSSRSSSVVNRWVQQRPRQCFSPSTVSLSSLPSQASSASASSSSCRPHPRKIAIVGGGLAGLSTAYHLLDLHRKQQLQHQHSSPSKESPPSSLLVTILDSQPVGTGGASAVAGGLLHPLTPRGTLVRDGIRALGCSRALIEAAERAWVAPGAAGGAESSVGTGPRGAVVLRDELYRVASSERQARALQETAAQPAVASMAEWIPSYTYGGDTGSGGAGAGGHGALRLHSGCQVVHVPSYLRGLWLACAGVCESTADARDARLSVRWEVVPSDETALASKLKQYDAIVLAAGSGLFASDGNPAVPILSGRHGLPVQLVRGQSVEIALPLSSEVPNTDAVLCGKYVSPLPCAKGKEGRAVLVGATHEYQPIPLTSDQVVKELRERTEPFMPPHRSAEVWDYGTVRRVTSGVRVQSARGKNGRLPIIGRWEDASFHSNAWIFTGLSSRGLLYHAMYGEILARAVLCNAEEVLRDVYPDSLWWKPSASPPSIENPQSTVEDCSV